MFGEKFQTTNSAIILRVSTHSEKSTRDLLLEIVPATYLILWPNYPFFAKKNILVACFVSTTCRTNSQLLRRELKRQVLGTCSLVPLFVPCCEIFVGHSPCGQSPRANTTSELFQGQVPATCLFMWAWRNDFCVNSRKCFLKKLQRIIGITIQK